MSRPGAPGTTHDWPITSEIWLVRPSSESAAQKTVVKAVRREAAAAGIQVEEVRCEPNVGHQGRRVEILPPEAVHKLYVRCHRVHVWVAAVGGVRFKLDPSLTAHRENLAPLSDLLQCKAAGCRIISRPGEVGSFLTDILSDLKNGCSGTEDARCLPLHAFAPGAGIDLSNDGTREGFEKQHRSRTRDRKKCWVDQDGRTWETAKAMHTVDQLHVAGRRLPVGFHWDVQTPRNRTILINGWQRWEATNYAYLNVHPDAHVRSSKAQLVWSWDKPKRPRGGKSSRK